MADWQAGWYPDPSGDTSRLRFWNGAQWTEDYTANPAQPQIAQDASYYYNSTALQPETVQVYAQQPAQGYTAQPAQAYQPVRTYEGSNDQTLALVAFIFCLLSTISVGWLILPLAWMIPMTVHCWGIYKGTKKNTTAFGVCTLIFVNLVSGILLLVAEKE